MDVAAPSMYFTVAMIIGNRPRSLLLGYLAVNGTDMGIPTSARMSSSPAFHLTPEFLFPCPERPVLRRTIPVSPYLMETPQPSSG